MDRESGCSYSTSFDACVWHGERAEAILAAHPDVASSDIHTEAILGDDALYAGSSLSIPRRVSNAAFIGS